MPPKLKTPKPGRTESQVLSQVIEAGRMLGIELSRQNTGGMLNPKGQYVAFGQPGNADLVATLKGGRSLAVEVKNESFDPHKLHGEKKVHFDRQVAKLKGVNDLGGIGFWTSDAEFFLMVMKHVLAGASVIENGYDRLEIVYPGRELS